MANTERVKEAVARAGLDAVLLMDDRDIYYATGFLPTDSAAIIARDAAWLVTDSRYIEAAQNQAAPGVEVVLTTRERPLPGILRELCDRNELERIGAEEEKLSHAMYLRMEKASAASCCPQSHRREPNTSPVRHSEWTRQSRFFPSPIFPLTSATWCSPVRSLT